MKRALAGVGIAAGLGLLGYALLSGQTEEEKIRARLEQLEESLEVPVQPSTMAVRGLQLRGEFTEIFEPEVRARIPELGSQRRGRDELAALAARTCAHFDTLDLQFDRVGVRLDGAAQGARVSCVVVLTAAGRGGREPTRDQRHVVFDFSKHSDHGWRIAAIRVTEPDGPDRPEG